MKPLDDFIKWLTKRKTMYGLAGMVVIIVVLAIDFSYWAGAIEVGDITAAGGNGESEDTQNYTINVTRVVDETDTFTYSGHGQSVPETWVDYPFLIEENASKAIINLTFVSGVGSAFGVPDLDLYVYGPDGEEVGNSATTSADETVTIKESKLEREGPGEYIARVHAYRGIQITYQITVDLHYKVPIENEEGGD